MPELSDETSPNDEASQGRELARCLYCGGSAFEWGMIEAPGHGGNTVRFQPDNGKLLLGFRWTHGPQIKGRCCTSCGNIQVFAAQ